MTRFLRQADAAWTKDQLGIGSSTIGRAGCLLTSLCIAAQQVRDGVDDAPILPDHANNLARNAGAFVGSGLIVEKAAPLFGFSAPRIDRVDGDKARLRACLKDLFGVPGGHMALLHVDRDEGAANGDPEADHWILGLRGEMVDVYDEPMLPRVSWDIVCADPATGEECRINVDTLQGTTTWGVAKKLFQVRSVQPLWRG